MNFKTIFQQKPEGFSLVNALFYFTVSMLIATVFCYAIFLIKNNTQRTEILEREDLLEDIGTAQQKQYEKTVLYYQKKIKDFLVLFENHEFASRTFAFMQDQTLSNIWFKQFNLDKKNKKIQLLGEAENMEIFSRQVANFERSEYVEGVDALNSSMGAGGRAVFNLNLNMKAALFDYIPQMDAGPIAEAAVTESSQVIFQRPEGSSGKMITVFDILLNPEVIGQVDQANRKISVDVPFGINVSNLTPLIITSPGAIVSPGSSVAQDFTEPVVYKVTARDGSTQSYTVTVNVLQKQEQEKNTGGLNVIFIVAGLVLTLILIISGVFLTNKLKNKKKK